MLILVLCRVELRIVNFLAMLTLSPQQVMHAASGCRSQCRSGEQAHRLNPQLHMVQQAVQSVLAGPQVALASGVL